MNQAEYIQKLDSLRDQIRKDAVVDPDLYPAQLAKANDILEEIASHNAVIPDIKPVLFTLRQTLVTFYSINAHRGWAQQYALRDIQTLEELYPSDED